jgi:hypothetical protein
MGQFFPENMFVNSLDFVSSMEIPRSAATSSEKCTTLGFDGI